MLVFVLLISGNKRVCVYVVVVSRAVNSIA